jgi:membrane protease YdiL (CAAX protease family)
VPGPLPLDQEPPGSFPPGFLPRRAARPRGWPALAVYAVAFLLALVSSTLLIFAVALVRTRGQRSQLQAVAYEYALSAPGLMAGAATSAAVLTVVALLAARFFGPRTTVTLRLGQSRTSLLGAIAATLGTVGLSLAGGGVTELLGVRGRGAMDLLAQSLSAPSVTRFIAALLTIGVAPGFGEETFFRGFLQTRLTASWGRWPAIVVTALAFAALHLDLVQGSLVFFGGLFLGWVADRLGGVRPAILAHVINNAIFVTLAAFGRTEPPSRGLEVAGVIAGTLLFIVAVALLRSPRAVAA